MTVSFSHKADRAERNHETKTQLERGNRLVNSECRESCSRLGQGSVAELCKGFWARKKHEEGQGSDKVDSAGLGDAES
jgi:hypothetical protein